MPLFREGSATPVVNDGPVPMPLAEWFKDRSSTAVALANTDDVTSLQPRLAGLALITLHFPKFSDGRAYSQARILRERLGYRGELRATGGVLQDQLPFLLRCGFDSFESDQKGFGEALLKARTLFSVVYQPTEDGRPTVSQLRLQHRSVTLSAAQ
ncbi:MAG: DUF934 domain-containing protein [Proteobacteria bacterium]|nr:DUF934 domain-containing protein [Pseudomonadota bacterium]